MTTAPRLTPNRALHQLFNHLARDQRGATRIVFLNNGGRSKLVHLDSDGTVITGLAPTIRRPIWDSVIDAAHDAARAIHGPRRSWPTRLTFNAPTARLTYEDAAPHLGDHVLSNRVYTFSPAAAEAAHNVRTAIPLLNLGIAAPYHRELDTLRRLLHLPLDTPRSKVRAIALSYARKHLTP
ncbi:hypothetical protein ACWGIR_32035 [Streptomyces albidoflavus]